MLTVVQSKQGIVKNMMEKLKDMEERRPSNLNFNPFQTN